ncbi:hypothetical protein [Corallococcus exercitus]|uniref:hypothetical protein n=1 Tax=Corallococcus exercitus TaxID=2316736 RepID=UPI001ABF3168|nr:hypothetical protein [Corallococcus exercitus]
MTSSPFWSTAKLAQLAGTPFKQVTEATSEPLANPFFPPHRGEPQRLVRLESKLFDQLNTDNSLFVPPR